ncbi:hypothetical protein [Candidatus Chlamydia corallus]|uniref:hypothetical protein n=1 Tax=Candidatus Chlamydia corallus TaxID=2038470 RepID=UPI001EFDA234|nr:hypothetical protein [Candidatus Chlamydia corallus]
MLKSFLLFAAGSGSTLLTNSGGGVYYKDKDFLAILILLIFALGYCPTNPDTTGTIIEEEEETLMQLFARLQYAYKTGNAAPPSPKKKRTLLKQMSMDDSRNLEEEALACLAKFPQEEDDDDDDEPGSPSYQQHILECSGHLTSLFLGMKGEQK